MTWGENNRYCWINVDASEWIGDIDELEDELFYNLKSAQICDLAGFDEDSGTFIFCWKTDALKTGAL